MKRLGLTLAIIAALAVLTFVFKPAALPSGLKTHEVVIDGLRFSPATLTIHRGEAVRFKNADILPHTATETSSQFFDSGMINAGGEWKFVPTSEGTLHYHCLYHLQMKGSIIVEAPATDTGASGS